MFFSYNFGMYSDEELWAQKRARAERATKNEERFKRAVQRAVENPHKIYRVQCRNSYHRRTVHQLAAESHVQHRSIVNYYFVHENDGYGELTPSFSCVELNNGSEKEVIGSAKLFDVRYELKHSEMSLGEALMLAQNHLSDMELKRLLSELIPFPLAHILLEYLNTKEGLKTREDNWISLKKL